MNTFVAAENAVFASTLPAARANIDGEHVRGRSGKPPAHALYPREPDAEEKLHHKAIRIAAVGVLHIGLAAWLINVEMVEPEIQAPIRLDVRTVEIPPLSAAEMKQAITEAPKPLPAAPKPAPAAAKPVASHPKHASTPRLLQAQPSAEPASADFSTPAAPASPPATAEQAPSAPAASAMAAGPAGNAVTSAARFDADYLRNPAPAYPPMSRKLREEGEVVLDVKVTADGRAEQVRIRQGSGYARLDEAAQSAVQHWRFVPARRGNEPVAATVLVPLQFRLDR